MLTDTIQSKVQREEEKHAEASAIDAIRAAAIAAVRASAVAAIQAAIKAAVKEVKIKEDGVTNVLPGNPTQRNPRLEMELDDIYSANSNLADPDHPFHEVWRQRNPSHQARYDEANSTFSTNG